MNSGGGIAKQSDQSRQVLPCPHCGTKLRMRAGKRGTVVCPTCTLSLSADTTGSGHGVLKIEDAEFSGSSSQARPQPSNRAGDFRTRDWLWRAVAVGGLIAGLAVLMTVDFTSPFQHTQQPVASGAPQRSATPIFTGIENPLPASGRAWFCVFGKSGCGPLQPQNGDLAPFEIRSTGGQNYLLKLALPSKDHLLIFVRGGSPITVDVPLGAYTVTYATGTHWYGLRPDKRFFGPETAAGKFDDSLSFDANYETSVTLYTVLGGNLRSHAIPLDEF